ncbi:MAG: DUF58 domain-containing protein [Rubripirellula sp.]|nr:DUF58 domain-containing protein [Rubripirellula sp.]
MDKVHAGPSDAAWSTRLLMTDFCPWANRFVYWLKEPVGWFILAFLVSLIVGQYVSPVGWVIAASLSCLIMVGMLWPAIAVRGVHCSLSSTNQHCHEDAACHLRLFVRNRLPLPIWGLAVEGYLDRTSIPQESKIPTVALAFVKAKATSTYCFTVRPELRGRYPDGDVAITCSFPFGIWTATKTIKEISSLIVWPKVFPITGGKAFVSCHDSETGEGERAGRFEASLGIREYQHGDSLRDVNWRATAKTGEIMVTQRSGPRCESVELFVDISGVPNQDALSDRVRVAASIAANLHESPHSLVLQLGRQRIRVRRGVDGLAQMMNAFALIGLDGVDESELPSRSTAVTNITVSSNHQGSVSVFVSEPNAQSRSPRHQAHRVIDRAGSLASPLKSLWSEVRDGNLVA